MYESNIFFQLKSRESESITAAMVDSGIESADEDDTTTTKELWVEKFKPRCYMDLLSDVGTNRTLLKWLKLWDRFVFGKVINLNYYSFFNILLVFL